MFELNDMVRLSIDVAVVVFTIGGAIAVTKEQVKSARLEAAEAMKVGAAAHRRIDDHERRLSAAERDILNQGKNLELAMARLEGHLSALSGRFDSLLLRLTIGETK